MRDLPRRPVKELCSLIVDCVNRTAPVVDDETPYRMIRTTNVRDGRIDLSECRYADEDTYEAWTRRAKVLDGDVILTREAPIGEVGYVNGVGSVFLGQRIVQFRPDPRKVVPRYLYYAFRSPDLRHQFGMHEGSGSVVSHIRVADCLEFKVATPPLKEQAAVAALLGALDDKIDLNRRTNETLEAMAQAIFRDWFVDFGPVGRKLAGLTDPVEVIGGLASDPVRAAELARLFPDAIADDRLPERWSERAIGDLVEISGGSTPSTADESLWHPAEHRWATPKDLSNMSDLALFETSRRISSEGLSKITSGLLPPGTVLLSSRAPIGYLAVAQAPVAINQGFIALKPTADLGSAYLYLWCKAHMEAILANANGSTFQEISKKNFRPITSPLPEDTALLRAFGSLAQPLIDRIASAAAENHTLAETRDYLLPRLMSGEVRVGDVAQEIAA